MYLLRKRDKGMILRRFFARRAIFRSGIVVLSLVFVFVVADVQNRRPSVSLDQLLADNPSFPMQWNSRDTLTSNINWSVSKPFVATQSFLSFPNALRSWSAHDSQDTQYSIEQGVANYQSTFIAWAFDALFPLEQTHREDYGNLVSDVVADDRYPSMWSYKSATADQEAIVCADGNLDSCDIWLYRARYGQYMVSVRFYARTRGSSAATFAYIVAQIDSYVSMQLSK
jgi:hypothetical protein